MPANDKTTQEEAFRNGLDAAADLAERLVDHCHTVQDFVGILRLALENEGQFNLLMATVLSQPATKK